MASSSSSRKRKYDVFMSYRGEDTRLNIVSHIRRCLNNENIVSFKDDEMERGEEIGTSLKDAIESSMIALVIISERFAESRWCLDELQHILECKEKYGLKVYPIFFHVDPSHLRKPTTGVFAAYFSRHKERFDNLVVEKWISAMTTIGNLSGFPVQNGSEADLLDKVIEVILQNTEPLPCIDAKKLVGIGSHVRKLESLMRDTQCFIGITGMSGIGKTTIARVIFDLFRRRNFEGSIFLSVAELTGRSDERNIDLTKTFLSGLLKKEVIVANPFVRNSPDANSLLNKNLLIVLDDVNSEQFNNLLGELCTKDENGWYHSVFGSKTKVILISKDKKLLGDICSNGGIHEVEGLKESHALQLFCRHAFRQDYPNEEFKNLLWPFLGYSSGNPLALKVLGSSLHGKTKETWGSISKSLGKYQNQDIYKKLKIGYDQLDENQKTIFLYIACYFDSRYHYERQIVIDMLDSCGLGATHEIGVLKDKCLLERDDDDDGVFKMHKLLREMGKRIVKEESKNPGERSILWEASDILQVFKKTSESEAVEAIRLDLYDEKQQLILNPNDFTKMPCLKFIEFFPSNYTDNKLPCPQCPHGLDYLPDQLRLLKWKYYPLKRLPAQFQPTNLFELNLAHSKLEELWEGSKDLISLQSIDLCFSACLTKLPDLSFATNLMKIDLRYCWSLVEISSSIKNLHKLQSLDLSYCRNIRSLPCCIWNLKSLENLILDYCSELENLSKSMVEPSTSHLSPLKLLSMNQCRKIWFLPELSWESLQRIIASGCESLETSSFNLKQLFISQSTIEYLDDYCLGNIFNFTNCWKLDVIWADIATLAKKRIEAMLVLSYFKAGLDLAYDYHFFMGYPRCEIPKWITHQNMGKSFTLQIPVNEKLLGFAISAVLPFCDCIPSDEFPVRFHFENSSGYSFFWSPDVTNPFEYDFLSELEINTIIYGIPLLADTHSQMIDKLGYDGDYFEVTLHFYYCMCSIKRPENIRCGMIPLFLQNSNGKRLKRSLDETTEVIVKGNNGNLEVFFDDYRVKKPDQKILAEMYEEVMIDNPEVNHQGIWRCIWGNENCKKCNEVETFRCLNKDYESCWVDLISWEEI